MPQAHTADLIADLLLRYYRDPMQYRTRAPRVAQSFGNLDVVLRLALGRTVEFADHSLAGPTAAAELERAAAFYIQQQFFRDDATHYEVLGLTAQASPEAVRENFRLLMRLIHPDRQGGVATWPDGYAARVNRAHAVLKSHGSRADYDRELAAARAKESGAWSAEAARPTLPARVIPRGRRTVPGTVWPEWWTAGVAGFAREHPGLTAFAVLIGSSALLVAMMIGPEREAELTGGAAYSSPAAERTRAAGAAPPRAAESESAPGARLADSGGPLSVPPTEGQVPASVPAPTRTPTAPMATPPARAAREPAATTPTTGPLAAPVAAPAPAARAAAPPSPTTTAAMPARPAAMASAASPAAAMVAVASPPAATVPLPPPQVQVALPAPGVPPMQAAVPAGTAVPAVVAAPALPRRAAVADAPPLASAEVEALIASFVSSYERGRLDAFARLFDEDAQSGQQRGRAAIAGEYDEFFRSTAWRRMAVAQLIWKPVGDRTEAKGELMLKTGWRDGREVEQRVALDLELTRQGGRAVISKMLLVPR